MSKSETNLKNRKSSKKKIKFEDNIKLHKDLSKSSYKNSIVSIRKQLPKKRQRAVSHMIHDNGMDNFHDVIARTIARPICVIGGASFSLIGGLIVITFSRINGYQYNYLLIPLLYIFGYLIVLFVELVVGFFIKSE